LTLLLAWLSTGACRGLLCTRLTTLLPALLTALLPALLATLAAVLTLLSGRCLLRALLSLGT
jgi:hypothetical protein